MKQEPAAARQGIPVLQGGEEVKKASEIMVFSTELSIPEEIESAHAGLVEAGRERVPTPSN